MDDLLSVFAVAPLVGARVEIFHISVFNWYSLVAPLVGARVEITIFLSTSLGQMSLPSWERGLKYTNKIVTTVQR